MGKGGVIRTGVTFGQVGFQSRATFPATPNSQPPPTNINFNFNVSFGDRWISNGHMTVRFSGRWIKIFKNIFTVSPWAVPSNARVACWSCSSAQLQGQSFLRNSQWLPGPCKHIIVLLRHAECALGAAVKATLKLYRFNGLLPNAASGAIRAHRDRAGRSIARPALA